MPPEIDIATIAQVTQAVGTVGERSLLVVASSMAFGKPLTPRVGVLDVTAAPTVVWEGFLPRDQVEALAGALGASQGGWDAMFSTAWSKAWTSKGAFSLWTPAGIHTEASVGRLVVEGVIYTIDADHVDTYALPGWVERGVRVKRFEGPPQDIVEESELMAEADPTYDLIDLEGDAGWAVALGKALADALAVPHYVSWR
ncbi:MAG: hypothetical protein KC912_24330 [Proteobacteria bacterium]|nr:hypothetical protein [Pseudomonadota bacterium]